MKVGTFSIPTYKFKYGIRVRPGETNCDGIVLCTSLFSYMDVVRAEYMRHLKFSYPRKWQNNFQNNFHDVIVSTACEVKRPAHFDDELLIFAKISSIQKTIFSFDFKMYQTAGYKWIAEASSSHAVINPKKWGFLPIPDFFRESVNQFENKTL